MKKAEYRKLLDAVKSTARADGGKDTQDALSKAASKHGLEGNRDLQLLARLAGEPLRFMVPMAPSDGYESRIKKAFKRL